MIKYKRTSNTTTLRLESVIHATLIMPIDIEMTVWYIKPNTYWLFAALTLSDSLASPPYRKYTPSLIPKARHGMYVA